MKKNLLSILILALLVVNIIMTGIMMISVTSTNKKTAAVIGDIASILNIELDSGKGGEEGAESISIKDTAVYNIADKMTIPLKVSEDGKQHYAIVAVSLAMNTKDKDYKTYGATIGEQESLIKGEINEAFSEYTYEDLLVDTDVIREDILKRIQKLFDSQFVYKVTFSDLSKQ